MYGHLISLYGMHLGITGEELKHCKKNNYNIMDALILPAKLEIIARKAEAKSKYNI